MRKGNDSYVIYLFVIGHKKMFIINLKKCYEFFYIDLVK